MWRISLVFDILILSLHCNGEIFGPGNQYIIEGEDLVFECKSDDLSSGLTLSGFTFIEEDKDDGNFKIRKGTVKNLQVAQSKTKVECEAGFEVHQFTVFVIPASDVPDIVQSEVIDTMSVELGNNFVLNCTEIKLDNVVFVWYRGGCMVHKENGAKTSLYKVNKVSREDGGIYSCVAENPKWRGVDAVSDRKYYRVNVTLAKVDTVEKDAEIIAEKGKNIELDCEIAGFPADIIWEKDGTEIAKHVAVYNISSVPPCLPLPVGDKYSINTDGKTLHILNVDYEDRGQYLCIGRTDKNSVEHSFILRVRDPLGALWPFLGILIEALLLFLVIFVSEKRRESAKKKEKDTKVEFSTSSSDGSKNEKVRLRTTSP